LIEFTLNGQPIAIHTDPARPLLRVIREDLGLTGTKQSCDMEGECGACTVLVDGEAQRSCLIMIGEVAGRSVTTIEGLGTPDHPHPLQLAFLEAGAVQCGYCTPGMLLSAKALLDRNLRPSREEIVAALAGNLCRCTGYLRIVEAVASAGAVLRGERPVAAPETLDAIGGDLTRHNGWARVSGATRYAEDITLPDMHYIRLVRSPHYHARVLALDPAPGLAVPGVKRVLTAGDIPGENGLGGYSVGEHLLAPVGGKVRMVGDAVALVVATTPEAAEAGAAAVQVSYEELPHALEIEHALAPGAVQVHDGGNLLASYGVSSGDAGAVLASSDAVVEATYETAFQAHMAMERESAVAYIQMQASVSGGPQEILTVLCGSHEPHWARGYLAKILDLPPEQIRVITPPIGGSFGGRQDVYPIAITALAAYHLRKPVRLAYTRQEVMEAAPKRHPYMMRCAVGARRLTAEETASRSSDGSAPAALTGMRIAIQANTGAYDSAGRYIAEYAVTASVGPYRWQGVEARAQVIYSNGPKAGQFRGFGTPQPVFAMECALDELCQQLGEDPLEFRLRNALADGEITGLGYPVEETLGFRQVLEVLRPEYLEMRARVAAFNVGPWQTGLRRGVGLAGMMYRFGKFGIPRSLAEAELGLDGQITIYASAGEFGQGIETVFTQLAAENLGVPRAALQLVNADTARTLDGDVAGASRATYWVGSAIADAARRLRAAILSTAAEMKDLPPGAVSLALDGERLVAVGGLARPLPLAMIAAEMEQNGHPRRIRGQMDLTRQFPPVGAQDYLPFFLTAAHVAEVEVEMETGQTKVRLIVAAHDVGKLINPRDAVGQVEGGVVMGLGTALIEELIPGQSTGYSSYAIPTITSVPEIRVHLVELPGRYAVYGVKGLGEATILPTAPAIINAVSRAIGARIRRIPATPERILAAWQALV
jgi:aldehyde oxidoreductase